MIEPVPCNGCQACCKLERVILSPENGDDPELYLTVPTKKGNDGPVEWMLAHQVNGDCIYLDKHGCSIHGKAPWACRQFDCRKWLLGFPEAEWGAMERDIDGDVVRAARARL